VLSMHSGLLPVLKCLRHGVGCAASQYAVRFAFTCITSGQRHSMGIHCIHTRSGIHSACEACVDRMGRLPATTLQTSRQYKVSAQRHIITRATVLSHGRKCCTCHCCYWTCHRCCTGSHSLQGQSLTFGEWMSSWCCCSIFREQRRRYSNGVLEDDSTEPPFHTDADHREFVSAGAAAGLAVCAVLCCAVLCCAVLCCAVLPKTIDVASCSGLCYLHSPVITVGTRTCRLHTITARSWCTMYAPAGVVVPSARADSQNHEIDVCTGCLWCACRRSAVFHGGGLHPLVPQGGLALFLGLCCFHLCLGSAPSKVSPSKATVAVASFKLLGI